jgi:hypothetical protein
MVLIR